MTQENPENKKSVLLSEFMHMFLFMWMYCSQVAGVNSFMAFLNGAFPEVESELSRDELASAQKEFRLMLPKGFHPEEEDCLQFEGFSKNRD